MAVARGQLGGVDQGRITEGAVVVLQAGAADAHGVGEGFLDGGAGHVEDQVLVAGGLNGGDGVVESVDVGGGDAQHDARVGGQLAGVGVVALIGGVQDHGQALDGLESLGGQVQILDVQESISASSMQSHRALAYRVRETKVLS